MTFWVYFRILASVVVHVHLEIIQREKRYRVREKCLLQVTLVVEEVFY